MLGCAGESRPACLPSRGAVRAVRLDSPWWRALLRKCRCAAARRGAPGPQARPARCLYSPRGPRWPSRLASRPAAIECRRTLRTRPGRPAGLAARIQFSSGALPFPFRDPCARFTVSHNLAPRLRAGQKLAGNPSPARSEHGPKRMRGHKHQLPAAWPRSALCPSRTTTTTTIASQAGQWTASLYGRVVRLALMPPPLLPAAAGSRSAETAHRTLPTTRVRSRST